MEEEILKSINEFYYINIDDGEGTFSERARKSIGHHVDDQFEFDVRNTNLIQLVCNGSDYEQIKCKVKKLIADNVTYRVLKYYEIEAEEYINNNYLEISERFCEENISMVKETILEYANAILAETEWKDRQ